MCITVRPSGHSFHKEELDHLVCKFTWATGIWCQTKNETILRWEMSNIKVEIRLKFLTVRVIKKEHFTGHYERFFAAKHFVRRGFNLKTPLQSN